MYNYIFAIALLFQSCGCVIYDLDDVEYDRMPPLFALEQYDVCLRHNGTYCVARFDLVAEPNIELMNLITEYSYQFSKHYNHSIIDRGICVTKTCEKYINDKNIFDREELGDIVTACVNESVWSNFGLQTTLSTLFYCDKDQNETEVDVFGWLLLALFTFLLLTNFVGTCYDILLRMNNKTTNNYSGNRMLLSFSVLKNFENLINPGYENDGKMDFKAFNGAKVISSTTVVFAHTLMLFSFGFTDNPHDFEKGYDSFYYQLIFSGLSIINIFFVMSGFLLAYKLQKSEETHPLSWSELPKLMLQRWFRLSTTYAFVLLFSASWLDRMGSGPLWKLFVSGGIVTQCRKYWWQHLLYFHNYNSNDNLCIIPSWQLAADMQLFLVGVMVYIVTSPRNRMPVLIMLSLLGSAMPAIQIWLQDLDAIVLLFPESYRAVPNYTFLLLHIRGHNNLACYAIGMAAGSLVYNRQKQRTFIKHKVTRYFTTILVWTVIPAIAAILLNGRMFYDGEQSGVGTRMAYAAGQRLVLGIIVAMAAIAVANNSMVSENNQQLTTVKQSQGAGFWEWQGWVVPAQLSYCVSLLHITILHIILGSRTQLEHVSFFTLLVYFLGVLFLAYLLAFPVYLLVEGPTKRILDSFATRTDHEYKDKKIS